MTDNEDDDAGKEGETAAAFRRAFGASPKEVLERFYPAIVAKWRRIAGRRGYRAALVDDAIGEASVKLVEKLHTLRDPLRLEAFANQIFIRCMLTLIDQTADEGPLPDDAAEWPSTASGPEDGLLDFEDERLRQERLAIIRRTLATLKARDREIFEMFYGAIEPPKTAKEIATAIGLGHDRVRHILMKIRRKIRSAAAAPSARQQKKRAGLP
jgi:RNA polymerase sigma factor (sigma-70 family)